MLLKIDDIDEVCAFGNRILQLFLTASISAGAKSLEDVSLGRGSWLDVGPSRPIELNPSFPALAPGFDPFSALALGNAFRHPLPKFSQAPPSPPPAVPTPPSVVMVYAMQLGSPSFDPRAVPTPPSVVMAPAMQLCNECAGERKRDGLACSMDP